MADTHNAPIKVFTSLNMIYNNRNRFLDPKNLCFDASLTSLGGILTVLDHFQSFGIMADAHNAPSKVFSNPTLYLMAENDSLTLKTYVLAPFWLL